ncbi:NEDD8-activating enzyme E1 regulatory subunit [Macrosteles quadrilineatus]|uniref:NEDD8-activating enzyme E1 regulatory subunit n=1 Tax=Macrosteles quadrilineatus TaxID=74068 RepID=UPI0023E2F220|nr:NEDD8-activating enzyme E1 regulatory subunit [Macrosteles quadrilineatus]
MASPAPKSPEQSEKTKKYDRQLRLWGDHGQSALEAAHICLINATGMGTEILKSLVLPGIGAFTIVDGKTISEEDLGSNFFTDVDSVGKSRAEVTTQFLLELNPDVRGDYVEENPIQLFENNPHFFSGFNVVIATGIPERLLIPLSKHLWEAKVPLIVARSYGFIGSIRIQIEEHTVIESHPDNMTPDLRLDSPFPALKQYMDSINLQDLELKDHCHVPYLVPLYKCLVRWREEHNGALPKNYKEKESLREHIRSEMRRDEHGNPVDEENFEEAIRAVNFAVMATTLPKNIEEILNDSSCVNLTSKSKPFWIIAKAVRDFVKNEGAGNLPLRGSLPDMTADTSRYITLQQLYYTKASRDAEVVYRRVQQLLHQLNQPDDLVSEADVKQFCKHAASLSVLRGSCIADEYDPRSPAANTIAVNLETPDSLMVYHVMMRGVDKFFAEYNTYPGEFDDQVEPDIVKLKSCIAKLLNEWGCPSVAKDDYVHEICRYGGAELHSVSSFLGGCVAQETIKLITGQYKPINNTFLYDAITSNTSVFLL